jgi:hypothetical protein
MRLTIRFEITSSKITEQNYYTERDNEVFICVSLVTCLSEIGAHEVNWQLSTFTSLLNYSKNVTDVGGGGT